MKQMHRQRYMSVLWLVLLAGIGLFWCSQSGSAQGQEGPAAADSATTDTSGASLMCPAGMVLVRTLKLQNEKQLDAFCIDILEYPNVSGSMPAHGITWIEAEAMCFKEGKRLCKPAEWQAACSGPLGLLYPYGNTYQQDRCNTEGEWMMNGSKVVVSGAFPGCMSGYGVVDMSGNISEWTAGEGDKARIYGGSFLSGRYSSCTSFYTLTKTRRYVFNGVRCCMKPAAGEPASPR
ncbi:MAG TPA: SUMF1/EgtB/PvdO family nonheme iron enzyme [bacterium]|nr:SUMF1/EgtB/PvdO family nonheme iron enzyme [bacterium]